MEISPQNFKLPEEAIRLNEMPNTQDEKQLDKLLDELKIDLLEEIPKPQIAWSIDNLSSKYYSTLGTLGNFSLIIGKAKSKKSFFLNIAVSTALSDYKVLDRFTGHLPANQRRVLYFDTEQSKYHVQLAAKRICDQIEKDNPENLSVYGLRGQAPQKRAELIERAIYKYDDVGFVIIDGARDLITSINDEEQATQFSSNLLKWTEDRNLHIIVVLHQNKGDSNARGHVGSELVNKAETVLSVTVDSDNKNVSIVEAEQCRGIEPETFAFEIKDGLPVLTDVFSAKKAGGGKSTFDVIDHTSDEKKYELLSDCYTSCQRSDLKHAELIRQMIILYPLKFGFKLAKNKAELLKTYCSNKGFIIQEKPRSAFTLGELPEVPF